MSWRCWAKFDRMIATGDRPCSQCEEIIEDRTLFGKWAGEGYCVPCIEYECDRMAEERAGSPRELA